MTYTDEKSERERKIGGEGDCGEKRQERSH